MKRLSIKTFCEIDRFKNDSYKKFIEQVALRKLGQSLEHTVSGGWFQPERPMPKDYNRVQPYIPEHFMHYHQIELNVITDQERVKIVELLRLAADCGCSSVSNMARSFLFTEDGWI
jgi:hypothetical protein